MLKKEKGIAFGVPVPTHISTYPLKRGAVLSQEKKHSAKWDRCVDDVSKKGDVDSPEAVCTAQLGDDSYEAKEGSPAQGDKVVSHLMKAAALYPKIPKSPREADSGSAFPAQLRGKKPKGECK